MNTVTTIGLDIGKSVSRFTEWKPPVRPLASIAIRCEDRQCDFAIGNVVVHPFADEIFAGFIVI